MSKKSKNVKKNQKKEQTIKKDFLDVWSTFSEKHLNKFLIISLLFIVIFGLLLFDRNVSAGGDDSNYIIRAYKFIHNFKFPSFQGPLYPIVMSPFVLLFGIKVVPLKGLSLIFILLSVYFIYKSYKKRISPAILSFVLVFLSVNSFVLYYSSQTYVEAFYLLIQSVVFLYFFNHFIDIHDEKFNLKKDLKKTVVLGLLILLLGLTRSVGYAMIACIIAYFMFTGKWKSIIPVIISFFSWYGIYHLLKIILWGEVDADFASQGKGLLMKDYYDYSEGREDLMGFFQRLIDNSHLYLSKHFYILLGIREKVQGMPTIPWLTVVTYILFIMAFIHFFRKNRYLLFTGIYIGIFSILTFFLLQKRWDQTRLIIPYFPLMIIFIFSGLYNLFKKEKLKNFQFLVPVFFIVLLISSFKITTEKVEANRARSGTWHGLTPDWVNYIKMSKWSAINVPEEENIACRKPSISFIYSNGRDFTGLYRFPVLNTDEILSSLKDSSSYIYFELREFTNNNVPAVIQNMFRRSISYIVNHGGNLIGIYDMDNRYSSYTQNALEEYDLNYEDKTELLLKKLKEGNETYYVVSPDSLLNTFKSKDIDYVIMASLRVNPKMKTDRTINTIQRFLFFIEQKYPGIFQKIFQIGDDNNEPAVLYRIRYERYNE